MTADQALKAVVPAFGEVRGSRDPGLACVELIPGVLGEERRSRGSPYPGAFVVSGESVHVRRKGGLEESPGSVHVVDRYEREGAHHLEALPDVRFKDCVLRDEVGLCEVLPQALLLVEEAPS